MMNPKEYRQPRCPHGWVDVTQCEPCKTAAERDALQNEIDRLRSALAQQGEEQSEPVAWIDPIVGTIRHDYERFDKSGHQPLYAAPQPAVRDTQG